MRDGVKLHTLVLIPRGAARAPMLLTRTPYGATNRTSTNNSAHLSALIDSTDVADDAVVNGGYIRVSQDVRGKHGSEGDYVMTRPLQGPLNPTLVDHSTDTYDTIDWLVKNVPESNGKVAILGISYDGFTALMALVHPHPALKAAVPSMPWSTDGWGTTGFTMAHSVRPASSMLMTKKPRAAATLLGGPITSMTTTLGCRPVRLPTPHGSTGWNKWVSRRN